MLRLGRTSLQGEQESQMYSLCIKIFHCNCFYMHNLIPSLFVFLAQMVVHVVMPESEAVCMHARNDIVCFFQCIHHGVCCKFGHHCF